MVKYVVVTGGVISGVGKGITASSIGAILKAHGVNLTAIKIDPYINIDAGTFSPVEHGEVFVLDDGGEVDLDLGNYERFLNLSLERSNNITTGKIYQNVISKERRGDFLGKTVQVVPHITDEIKNWIERVANKNPETDVCLIELGGVVGDIESSPFVEALRQLNYDKGPGNFFLVHVSFLPMSNGELKSKPTQTGVRDIRASGLIPDMIICRAKSSLTLGTRKKLNQFCQVAMENIVEMQDCECLYEVPLKLFEQNVCHILNKSLDLNIPDCNMEKLSSWLSLVNIHKTYNDKLRIALVGKYLKLKDSYHSVIRALGHACLMNKKELDLVPIDSELLELDSSHPEFQKAFGLLQSVKGIVIPGGFGTRGVEGMIFTAKYAREHKIPILGVCFGFQIMAIEGCRNLLNISNATSEEFDPKAEKIVVKTMADFDSEMMGGTMRLGSFPVTFISQSSVLLPFYNSTEINERHRHRYEVSVDYVDDLESKGFKFVAKNVKTDRLEILEFNNHPYYVGTQFHPEFKSKPFNPSPPYIGLIYHAIKNRF